MYECIFWLSYLSGIAIVINRPDEYVRPLGFFVCIATATAILAAHLYNRNFVKYQNWWQLAKIALLCLTIQWSVLLLFPDSVYGSDPWYHHAIANRITTLEVQRIDYYGTLLFQIITSYTSQWLGISLKWSEMIFTGIPYTTGLCWLSYRFGTMIHSHRVGLFSALSLSFACMFLFFGIEIIPSSMGMLLAFVVVYLLLRTAQTASKWNIARYIMATILAIAVMYLNALMIIFTVGMAGLVWLGLSAYRKPHSKPTASHMPILYCTIGFAALTLIFWLFNTGQINIMFRFIRTNWLLDPSLDGGQWPQALSLSTASNPAVFRDMMQGIEAQQAAIPIMEQTFKRIGIVLYTIVGIVGCIISLSPKYRSRYSVVFAIMCLVIVLTNVINMVVSRYLFLSRHVMLTQIVLAPMCGMTLFVISRVGHRASTALVILALSATTIISPYINPDNHTFSPNTTTRLILTQEELSGIDEICTKWTGPVASDWYAGYYIYHTAPAKPWKIGTNYDASEALYYRDFTKLGLNTMLIIRRDAMMQPGLVLDRTYRFGYDPTQYLLQQGYLEVYNYNNGVVKGFVRK